MVNFRKTFSVTKNDCLKQLQNHLYLNTLSFYLERPSLSWNNCIGGCTDGGSLAVGLMRCFFIQKFGDFAEGFFLIGVWAEKWMAEVLLGESLANLLRSLKLKGKLQKSAYLGNRSSLQGLWKNVLTLRLRFSVRNNVARGTLDRCPLVLRFVKEKGWQRTSLVINQLKELRDQAGVFPLPFDTCVCQQEGSFPWIFCSVGEFDFERRGTTLWAAVRQYVWNEIYWPVPHKSWFLSRGESSFA